MQYLTMKNGDAMPALGLGTWKSAPGEVYTAVKEALRAGYRHVDCAPIYGNEHEVGRGIEEALEENGVARRDIWVTSKLWNSSHKAEQVRPALEKTLEDLRLDYLDMYLMHWPMALKPGVGFPSSGDDFLPLSEVPLGETWAAMEECARDGLARNIGVSNFSVKKLRELMAHAEIAPANNQIEMHPFLQQKALVEFCKGSVALTAYAPLGSKDRPERLKKPGEPILLEHPVISGIAEKHGASTAQVLIAWAIHRGTAVIPKSVNPVRIAENFEASQLALDDSDMRAMAELDAGYRYVDGKFWESVPGSPYTAAELWDE